MLLGNDTKSIVKTSTRFLKTISDFVGNLCCDCDEGRTQVVPEVNSIFEPLIKILEDRERVAKEDPGQRLLVIFPGCLLNLCNETPDSIAAVSRLRCVEVVLQSVLGTRTNDAVFNSALVFLQVFSECEVGSERLARCTIFPTGT